jgi:hypothetical protein
MIASTVEAMNNDERHMDNALGYLLPDSAAEI